MPPHRIESAYGLAYCQQDFQQRLDIGSVDLQTPPGPLDWDVRGSLHIRVANFRIGVFRNEEAQRRIVGLTANEIKLLAISSRRTTDFKNHMVPESTWRQMIQTKCEATSASYDAVNLEHIQSILITGRSFFFDLLDDRRFQIKAKLLMTRLARFHPSEAAEVIAKLLAEYPLRVTADRSTQPPLSEGQRLEDGNGGDGHWAPELRPPEACSSLVPYVKYGGACESTHSVRGAPPTFDNGNLRQFATFAMGIQDCTLASMGEKCWVQLCKLHPPCMRSCNAD